MPERNQAAAGSRAPASAGPRSLAHPDGSPSLDRVGADDPWSFDPATTAVVVVDVQRLFTDMVGAPIEPPLNDVLPRIGRFVDDSRKAGATVILVRTIIAPDAHSRSTRQWPEFMRAGMAPDTTRFDIRSMSQPATRRHRNRETALQRVCRHAPRRDTPRAWHRFDHRARPHHDVCVQSTARDAWQRDYETITLADCCAEIGPGSHDGSLAWTARNFGAVCKSDEVTTRWRRRPPNQVSTA